MTSNKSREYYHGKSDAERYIAIGVPVNVVVDVDINFGDSRVILHDVSPDYIQGLADAGFITKNNLTSASS